MWIPWDAPNSDLKILRFWPKISDKKSNFTFSKAQFPKKMSSGRTKVRMDAAYVDTRGTNVYWRDPKEKGDRKFSVVEDGNRDSKGSKPKTWDYEYGKKSSGSNRVKAADLYENWMDDPNALSPEQRKITEIQSEDKENDGGKRNYTVYPEF